MFRLCKVWLCFDFQSFHLREAVREARLKLVPILSLVGTQQYRGSNAALPAYEVHVQATRPPLQ